MLIMCFVTNAQNNFGLMIGIPLSLNTSVEECFVLPTFTLLHGTWNQLNTFFPWIFAKTSCVMVKDENNVFFPREATNMTYENYKECYNSVSIARKQGRGSHIWLMCFLKDNLMFK